MLKLRGSRGRSAKRSVWTVAAGLAVVFAAINSAPAAGDAAAGRKKAQQCQTCHGLDGKATIPEAPNLGGQNEFYLVKALTDYHTGARKNEMMSIIAPNLSETDIADLAAYYGSLPPVAGTPQ